MNANFPTTTTTMDPEPPSLPPPPRTRTFSTMIANPPTTTAIMAHEQPPPRHPRTFWSTHPVHKSIASAANLANLLPTGTVLAFRTLTPSFSNNGICQISNKYMTSSLVAFCSIICFLSSFTDSFTTDDADGNKIMYYGIATFKGFYIFNQDNTTRDDKTMVDQLEEEEEKNANREDLSRFRISMIDFVHAFVSLFVFLVFALCDSDVQNCFFPFGGVNLDELVMNLPLAAGIFSSFLFIIFPTTRRGIGIADMPPAPKFK
ncbi:hypothetical protein ACP275_14G136000 [Erythranthe tilingii]